MRINIPVILVILSLFLLYGCKGEQQSETRIKFEYSWATLDEDIHCSLVVEDSVIKYHPWAETPELVASSVLEQEARDSLSVILSGMKKNHLEGTFSERNIKVGYEITRGSISAGTGTFTPRLLNRFLFEQIPPYPAKIGEILDIPATTGTIYNDGTWNVLELKVFAPGSRKCLKHLTFTPDSVTYIDFEMNAVEQRRELSVAERDSLSQKLSHINLNVEYQFWDGRRKGWEMTGCPEAGIGLYLDGKCLALVISYYGMPTQQLNSLFECEYRMAPEPLYVYYDCFSGEDTVWYDEDDEFAYDDIQL